MVERIPEKYITIDSKPYSRIGADSIVLGSYGEVTSWALPVIGETQSLKHQGVVRVPSNLIRVTPERSIETDFQESLAAELMAKKSKLKLVSVDLDANIRAEDLQSSKITLCAAEVQPDQMVQLLNNFADKHKLQYLFNEKNSAVVTKIYFLTADSETKNAIERVGSIKFVVDPDIISDADIGGEITAEVNATNTLKLSQGTVLAYSMSNLVWDGMRTVKLEENNPNHPFTH